MARFAYFNTGEAEEMKKENLTSQVNSSRTLFTVSEEFKAASLRVYHNGVRQIVGVNVTVSSSTEFTLSFTPQTGDYLTVDYSAL
jgi:hypothetical protein